MQTASSRREESLGARLNKLERAGLCCLSGVLLKESAVCWSFFLGFLFGFRVVLSFRCRLFLDPPKISVGVKDLKTLLGQMSKGNSVVGHPVISPSLTIQNISGQSRRKPMKTSKAGSISFQTTGGVEPDRDGGS